MNETQKRIGGLVFITLLLLGMFGGIFLPDKLLSETERRTLAQFPELSWEAVMDKDYSQTLETYLLEQFPGRDIFRTIKAEFDTRVLCKSDSNGYVRKDGQLLEIPTSYNDDRLYQSGEIFQKIVTTYFSNSDIYYGVIPDKNYYVEEIPNYDLVHARTVLKESFSAGEEICLTDVLELEDYYRTDLHIKQESLIPLANTLLKEMGTEAYSIEESDYEKLLATKEFYGAYSANSAYISEPDNLYYLENSDTRDATVYDYETNTEGMVYTLNKLEGMDDYDVFLGGARALLTINNPNVNNGKTLLVFRDSFGSSISPLLLAGYEEITLVDLRYVSASYAMELLKERKQGNVNYDDVLFLYQVQVLYRSRLIF